jgi:hypothetical protein
MKSSNRSPVRTFTIDTGYSKNIRSSTRRSKRWETTTRVLLSGEVAR